MPNSNILPSNINTNAKIAVFTPFLIGSCKGGAEKMFLDIRDYYQAAFFVGSIELISWGKTASKSDDFVGRLWSTENLVMPLGLESTLPLWKYLKRQILMRFSPKIKELAKYDLVIFNFGNISFLPQVLKRINPKIKLIGYVNTPPRGFTDQFDYKLKQKVPGFLHPIVKVFAKVVVNQFKQALESTDYIVANSNNISRRLKKYVGVTSDQAIWPPVDMNNLKYLDQKDYYLSHARLESTKRIELIVEAFAKMPDKKLIITSSGPLKDWLINKIKQEKLTNIDFRGRVSDQERDELMGNCLAGIYIPENEDAGITQVEFNACGKPVIGVSEGGLLETVVDEFNGLLIPASPSVQSLIEAVNRMTPELALRMRENCQKKALELDKSVFFEKLDKVCTSLLS